MTSRTPGRSRAFAGTTALHDRPRSTVELPMESPPLPASHRSMLGDSYPISTMCETLLLLLQTRFGRSRGRAHTCRVLVRIPFEMSWVLVLVLVLVMVKRS